MKTLQITAIISTGIIASITLFMILTYALETKPHTEMKIIGLDNVYIVYQIFQFQIYAEGYGYSCVGTPEITIYDTSNPPIIVYHERSKAFMCPMETQFSSFSVYYPSHNDYYTTAIDQAGEYTLHVSYRNVEIEKEFLVKSK